MRVEVDFDLCEENAVCMGLAPTVFDLQEDGLHVLQEEPGEQLRGRVQDAERMCPVRAITVRD